MSEVPTPRTDAAAFYITWRNGAYYLSIPNISYETVVSEELAHQLACQLERELTAEKAAADAAKKVIASKEWTDSEACALMLVRKARSEHDALATQVAMLREALENIQVLSHVAYDRSATKNVLIRRKNNALVAKINDTASVALSATPETKHPDTERLAAQTARADALEALNATMHERISGLVADIAKYAGEVQELADIIIGGQCVPAPFSEVKRCALEMREDKARLDWLEDNVTSVGGGCGALYSFKTPADVESGMLRTAIDAARAQTP